MKKYNCLLALLVFVFLLLCACAREQTGTASSAPDTFSSAPTSSVPASSAPATSVPGTSTPVTSFPATAPSTAAPTQPATMPTHRLTYSTMDWVTDREIIPFEERFKEDVPFGDYPTTWITPDTRHSTSDYSVFYLWGLSVAMENGMEREYVYNIPVDPNLLAGFSYIAADGRWAYLCSDDELCKLELLTGEITTLVKKNEGDIRWDVQVCGKDTVCIFQLDASRNLRIYYRDLHSNAERTVYQGALPDVPTSENDLLFYAPPTTQGQVYWVMQNYAFREVYLKELNNPVSPLKPSDDLFMAVQDYYNIPMLVRYSCDFHTGALTEDFGLYDSCWQSADCKHNHFDYEISKKEVPKILDVTPVEIPNFSKLTGESPRMDADTSYTYIYSEFGYGLPYLSLDYPTWRLADFPVVEVEPSFEYIYCITLEGTIVQFNYSGSICNTIYTSENELRSLYYWNDYLYFIDGSTIVCIDAVAGTYRPIIQTNLKEIYITGTKYIDLYFGVRQGLYYQEYRFCPETNDFFTA